MINKKVSQVTPESLSGRALQKVANTFIFRTVTGNDSVTSTDVFKALEVNSADACNVSVDGGAISLTDFPVGGAVQIIWYGVGQPTIVATDGTTILSDGADTKIPTRYKPVVLVRRSLYEFYLFGIGTSVISGGTTDPGLITPAAPTAGTVDDTLDTFDFTFTPGYTTVSEYEYTLDGGTTTAALTAKPLAVGNVAKSAGQVGVRVKAATGRNASAWLFNAQPFTVAPTSAYLTWATNGGMTETNNGLSNPTASTTKYARSNETFSVGDTLEFMLADASTTDKMIGLGTNATPSALADINGGLYVFGAGLLYKAASGTYTNLQTSASGTDKLRVKLLDSTTIQLSRYDGTTDNILGTITGTFSTLYCIAAIEGVAALKEIKKL